MNPNAAANLTPFRPGHQGHRRNRDVEQCFKLARKHSPEAMQFLIATMRDNAEDMRYRIKSAEVIIGAATPKNPDTIAAMLGDGFTSHLTISFVNVPPAVTIDQPAGTNRDDRPVNSNGHDPSPLTITFVNPEEC